MSTRPNTRPQGPRTERGFILLVVLSAIGLLALVAASFTQIARTHVKVASATVEGARAEALADAGVQLAVMDLVAASANQGARRRFALDATLHVCGVASDGATLTIAVRDEAGKIDLNIGSEAILRALVLGLGVEAGEAAADAILDFRDDDDNRRPAGAERREYEAAGRTTGPKNAPFAAIEELGQVLPLTPADVDLLRPFVTIHSGQTGVDPSVASSALVDILVRGAAKAEGLASAGAIKAFAGIPKMVMGRDTALPAQLVSASTRHAFSVQSEARTASGAIFVREAVVELAGGRAGAHVFRRWHRGAAPIGAPQAAQVPPPC